MTEPQSSAEDPGPRRGGLKDHAPFLGTTLTVVVALIALLCVMQWGPINEKRLNFFYQPLVAGVIGGLVLWCLIYGWWRGPLGWRLALPLLLLAYLGIERFGAPYFSRVYRMGSYLAIQDPDHLPRHVSAKKGWNSDSLRCPHQAEDFREEDTNVIILGDSFTFGMKLKPLQAFPVLVEKRLQSRFKDREIRVANFGWVSSSPLLSWRRLLDIGEKYSPDLVVMCVDMTDIRDDIRWRAILNREGMYGVIGHIPLTLRGLQELFPQVLNEGFGLLNPNLPQKRFFMCESPLEETRQHFGDIENNLRRIKKWCDEHGAEFVVIILPRTFQYSDRECPDNWEKGEYTVLGPYSLEPFRFFEELAERVDYPIYTREVLKEFQETEIFPTSFEDDPHWNADGAKLASKVISRILIKEMRQPRPR